MTSFPEGVTSSPAVKGTPPGVQGLKESVSVRRLALCVAHSKCSNTCSLPLLGYDEEGGWDPKQPRVLCTGTSIVSFSIPGYHRLPPEYSKIIHSSLKMAMIMY